MEFKDFVRGQLQFGHATLEQVIDGTEGILHDRPAGGTLHNIATSYAHIVLAEDMIVNGMIMGAAPVFMEGGWSAKTGVPPRQMPAIDNDWGAAIKMNLPVFREYAKAVYARSDEVIAKMSAEKEGTAVRTPFGDKQLPLEFLSNLGVTHLWGHMGEIAALKGVKGLKGLPF